MVFEAQDFFLIGFLALLEGILSVDNAVVLALMVRPLPIRLQRRALTYGLGGAVVFRLIALSLAAQLMRWHWVKWLGGGYLVFVAAKHFLSRKKEDTKEVHPKTHFWKTVLMIEVMDIAFAVDSILAAVALSNKFWVVFTGGMMGVVMMRFAASLFLRILKRFPHFETTAFLLVGTIGIKLLIDAFHFQGVSFDSPSSPAFYIFWGVMFLNIALGFRPKQPLK